IVQQVQIQAREICATISSQHIRIQNTHQELVNIPPVILQDPVTSKRRERPVGTRNKKTMQRDPSAFEHIEKQSRQ
ncbi:22125_t:CDS:2, partial [Gigaspora rosea]